MYVDNSWYYRRKPKLASVPHLLCCICVFFGVVRVFFFGLWRGAQSALVVSWGGQTLWVCYVAGDSVL